MKNVSRVPRLEWVEHYLNDRFDTLYINVQPLEDDHMFIRVARVENQVITGPYFITFTEPMDADLQEVAARLTLIS
jgi:hypothetical protein